jgi:hypothetical protein
MIMVVVVTLLGYLLYAWTYIFHNIPFTQSSPGPTLY